MGSIPDGNSDFFFVPPRDKQNIPSFLSFNIVEFKMLNAFEHLVGHPRSTSYPNAESIWPRLIVFRRAAKKFTKSYNAQQMHRFADKIFRWWLCSCCLGNAPFRRKRLFPLLEQLSSLSLDVPKVCLATSKLWSELRQDCMTTDTASPTD